MDPNMALAVAIMDDDFDEEENRELAMRIRMRRFAIRDVSNPLESMPRKYFRHHYRLQKETVYWLCEVLAPRIQQMRNTSIPIVLQVLCTLRFLAQGSYQLSIGESEHLCLSQASVSRVVNRISTLMATLANEWVKFPRTVDARARASAGFQILTGFPGVIGCIDGTQIPIFPPNVMPWMYLNHNRTHSLNIQATCDHDMKITSLMFFPGSTHDARIWRQSAVKQEMDRLHRDRVGMYHLLGDQGYPLQPGLLTPYRDPPPDSPEARYNDRHTHTRSIVERVFGRLKGRWRCLKRDRTLHYKPERAGRFIKACTFLHNLAIHLNDPPQDAKLHANVEADINVNPADNIIVRGRNIREEIVRQYFARPE